jgi:hypothetical protein
VFSFLLGTYGGVDVNEPGFQIDAFSASGGGLYSTRFTEFDRPVLGSGFGVDGAGRATAVGRDASSVGVPRLFRVWHLDANGNVDWEVTPSLAAGMQGSGRSIHVWPDGRSLVEGTALPSQGQIVAEFAADGSETSATISSSTGDRIQGYALDPRGNVLLHAVGTTGATVVAKWIDGGPIGTPYCAPAAPNSTGLAAEITALGASAAAADNVTLLASQVPPQTTVLFLASQAQGNIPGVGGGQGTLCLGNPIGRFAGPRVRMANSAGLASLQIDLDRVPQGTGFVQVQAGSTWNLQAWYRDTNPAATSNLTSAVSVVFQ